MICNTLPQPSKIDIGTALALLRSYAEISQAELARRVNVSRVTVGSWERGDRRAGDLRPVCRALGTDVPRLLTLTLVIAEAVEDATR